MKEHHDPEASSAGHNGTEQGLSKTVAAQALGQPGGRGGLTLVGGTPNHEALAAAAAYGYARKAPAGSPDATAGRARALAFMKAQMFAHMAVARMNEFGTASHIAWWQAAMAGLWLQAHEAEDAEMLALARRWWVHERTVEDACADPKEHVVMLGARSHVGGVDADQRKQRDQGRAILEGIGSIHLPPDISDPKTPPAATDRIGLWLLMLVPKQERAVVANAPAEMPAVLNEINIQRNAAGVVSWADRFDGLRPAYFAWEDFKTGEEIYGCDPSWPKGQKGGPRPESMTVPALPAGGGTPKVWHLQ